MKHALHCILHDAGLTAMALLAAAVLVLETGLWLAAPESTLVKEHRSVLRRALADAAPDLLVMGDSVARDSVLVGVLAEQLGPDLRIRNDGLQGTGPEIAYFVLRRELDAGKAPRAILYAPSPHTFASTRMHIAAGGFCTWPEIWDLLRTNPDRMDVLGGLVLRGSYTVRYREQIRELLKGHREVLAFFRSPTLDEAQRVARYEQERAHRPPVDFSRQTLTAHFRMPFSVAPANDLYLTRFLDLAERHDIRIYWATPPCLQRAFDSREKFGFNTQYYAFLDRVAARPGVSVIQREFPIYPDADFYDQNHFDIPAARRFSTDLGLRLKATVGSQAGPPRL